MYNNVLSPWASVDFAEARGINPRPASLDGKTVGMFSHFKEHSPIMLRELEVLLKEKLPNTNFKHLQYPVDTREIVNDPDFDPILKEWLTDVDVVISAYGDAGSCAMFHAYNSAYVEKLGVPVVMLCKEDLIKAASRGASARLVPAMRFVKCDMLDLSMHPVLGQHEIDNLIKPFLPPIVESLLEAMLRPVSQEEATPPSMGIDFASMTFSGTAEEIDTLFYKYGWTTGTPIRVPTREAVDEMLKGTDLPADYVVGKIPPMLGNATVEKIAVNAVMAGCLPTYMPILIAAVKGMLDPKIHLEGWTCSVQSWAPMIVVGGPVAKAIHMNGKGEALSPYYKPNAAIARAIAFIIMNIGGVRPGLEDMSELGHEGRLGICFTENLEDSPWGPMHTDYGFEAEESTITLFWPYEKKGANASTPEGLLDNLCNVSVLGWSPGAAIIMSPKAAQMVASAGFTRQQVLDYMVEYNRQPGDQVLTRWIKGNNHLPCVELPVMGHHMARRFWDKQHLFLLVAGRAYGSAMQVFTGGGDHGGPSVTKIDLPANWRELTARYDHIVPDYIPY